MRKIYKLALMQYLTYEPLWIFKAIVKPKDYWIIGHVRYVYANNLDEAKEKYKMLLFKDFDRVVLEWMDWYELSDEQIFFLLNKRRLHIGRVEIVLLEDESKTSINVGLDELKKYMSIEDFKSWWFDSEKPIIGGEKDEYKLLHDNIK